MPTKINKTIKILKQAFVDKQRKILLKAIIEI
jgi:hypothetical protein